MTLEMTIDIDSSDLMSIITVLTLKVNDLTLKARRWNLTDGTRQRLLIQRDYYQRILNDLQAQYAQEVADAEVAA